MFVNCVPVWTSATVQVNVQLTTPEACLSPSELQAKLRDTFEDYLSSTATPIKTVQVARLVSLNLYAARSGC
eukprot:1238139-Rhodomonas_salina.6